MKKRVLVTGADGFIGSHLTELLVNEGYNVRAFVYYNSFNSYGWLESLPSNILSKIEIYSGDVRDPYRLRKAVEGCEIVFHLAALISIPYSYNSPESYIDTNIKGTLNVLQAAKDFQIKRIIITSTSEVYGTALKVPIEEDHPKQAQSPYSASKIASDAITESFYKSFGLPITIVRPFNTFGPRQSARAIIPTIISQLLNGVKELKLGELSPTRDFVYVKDTALGFLEVAKADKLIGHEVNISSQSEISIGDLSKILIQKINKNVKIILDNQRLRPEKSEVYRLMGSNKKIKRYTNWVQKYSFEKAIDETISWFSIEENLKNYKSDIFNV